MVKRVFQFLYKEFSSLHQAAFVLGLAALASQILALLRDRLLAGTFGADLSLDIYYTAFRIPDLIYVSIASFVSVTVLIPFIIQKTEEGELIKLKNFLNGIFTLFCLVMIGVSFFLFFLMPKILPLIAPGFSSSAQLSLLTLSRILLLSPFLLGLSNLFGSVTQASNRFLAYTLSPLFYNLGIIIGITFFLPYLGLQGLAWGVVLGALLHLLIQLPIVYQSGIIFWPTLKLPWREIKEVILVSLPRTVTLSVHQLSILVLIALGSFLVEGSISVFNFAFNLQSVPLMIIGVSYSVAAFPTLTKLFSGGQSDEFKTYVALAIRHILFWSLPAIGLFIVLRAQIVRVILGSGEFSWSDTRLTAAALALFVISVAGQSVIHLFVRSYYASGRTKKPLIINTLSSLMIIIMAFGLLKLFDLWPLFRFFVESLLRVEGLPGTAILMLPLAFTLGMLLNTFLFWFYFEKDFGCFTVHIIKTFFQSLATAIFAGFVAYLVLLILAPVLNLNTFWGILSQGFMAGSFGIGGGLVMLITLKNEELREFTASFKTRFSRVRLVVPEQEEL